MKKILIVVLIAIVLGACSSNKINKQMPVAKKMEIAEEFFAKKKYHKAIPYYTDVAFERNSTYTSEAQLKLADCYFFQNKFTEARFEYEELIRLFRDAKNINRAYFQVGICYWEDSLSPHYTQEDTRSAIHAFETFLEKFPFDERKQEAIDYLQKCHKKLIKKKYYNGYAYFKMHDYPAAFMYFNEIIELENLNDVDKMSLYYEARMYIVRMDKNNSENITEKLNVRYPDSKETIKINKLIKKKFK
ncbi:MAG: outer membrane protein assembly factor BamD [Candidatus Cloacimonadales bacterium]|nr:outer membrane protein assembly factor BamD [Candidatus Cloacimonadales bacterium]